MTETVNVAPRPETEHSPEAIVRELTARIDRGLAELGAPPREARGGGWCNYVTDAVSYCAIQDAQEKGYEGVVAKYRTKDLHLIAAGVQTLEQAVPEMWSWRLDDESHDRAAIQERIGQYCDNSVVSEVNAKVFWHGFNVVEVNGELFLIDLSFSQFFAADGTLSQDADGMSSGIPSSHPLAQQLLRDGYIPLNDETLRTYMRFLCVDEPEYLSRVSVAMLNDVPALPFDMEQNELMGSIPPSYKSES